MKIVFNIIFKVQVIIFLILQHILLSLFSISSTKRLSLGFKFANWVSYWIDFITLKLFYHCLKNSWCWRGWIDSVRSFLLIGWNLRCKVNAKILKSGREKERNLRRLILRGKSLLTLLRFTNYMNKVNKFSKKKIMKWKFLLAKVVVTAVVLYLLTVTYKLLTTSRLYNYKLAYSVSYTNYLYKRTSYLWKHYLLKTYFYTQQCSVGN